MKLLHAVPLANHSIQGILVLILLALIACSACSFGQDKSIAEGGVTRFHEQFNAGQYREIYGESGEQVKKSATETQFVSVFEGTRHKLGLVRGSQLTRWKVNATTSGTFAIVIHDTEFSEGRGTESFVFQISDGKPTLVGYHVESPLFATK